METCYALSSLPVCHYRERMTTKVLNEIYEFLVEKDPSMPHVGTIPIPTQFPYKPRPKPQCLHASNACKTCCISHAAIQSQRFKLALTLRVQGLVQHPHLQGLQQALLGQPRRYQPRATAHPRQRHLLRHLGQDKSRTVPRSFPSPHLLSLKPKALAQTHYS